MTFIEVALETRQTRLHAAVEATQFKAASDAFELEHCDWKY
jgi:hypothetical protein